MVSEIGGEILLPKNPPTATLVVHKKLDTSQNVELHFYPTRTKRLGRSYHWILDLLQAVLGRVVVVSIGSKKAAYNGNISFPYNIFYVGERKTCWDKLEQFEKATAGETRKWGQGARKRHSNYEKTCLSQEEHQRNWTFHLELMMVSVVELRCCRKETTVQATIDSWNGLQFVSDGNYYKTTLSRYSERGQVDYIGEWRSINLPSNWGAQNFYVGIYKLIPYRHFEVAQSKSRLAKLTKCFAFNDIGGSI